MPQAGAPSMGGGAGYAGSPAGGHLSIDFGIVDFAWRFIVMLIGTILVIPYPWVLVWFITWFVPCISVPGRSNLSFEGNAMTIVPWYFGAIVVALVVYYLDIQVLHFAVNIMEIALLWLFLRWYVANIASNGQLLGLSFSGTVWAFVGWNILLAVSFITIIGWAWVYTAQMRWFYRNIQGTRREVTFTGTGLEFLWRAIVAGIASIFIIPIPWMYRWFGRWLASQTVLVERA